MIDNSTDPDMNNSNIGITDDETIEEVPPKRNWKNILFRIFLAVLLFASGLGSGYFLWGRTVTSNADHTSKDATAMINAINPKEGFKIQAKYGEIGPALISAGAIEPNTFIKLYEESGLPLSDQEIDILLKGSQKQIVFTRENAHFLLNLFWALGLTNKNILLDEGPIQQGTDGKIENLASTGGWTIATKPVKELFSSTAIISLTNDQQAWVEEVAKAVYRPCCDNPTHFPDCNHGMAMLGLLELMASQGANKDEMFTAAKYANAFWFPQQTLEQAIFFKTTQNVDYKNIEAKVIVGQQFSSASGFQNMHQWLADNGLLEQAPKSGNNCGV